MQHGSSRAKVDDERVCAKEAHDPESVDGCCHILEWRDPNRDIAPEAKFDGDAGRDDEGARQAQAKRLHPCKRTEEMKDGTLKSPKPYRKMDELKERERTHPREV